MRRLLILSWVGFLSLPALAMAQEGPAAGPPEAPEAAPAEAPEVAPVPVGAPVTLRVQVPLGATLFVDGHRSKQVGEMRHFRSPPLPPGSYTYELTGRFTRNGETVRFKKTVPVTAGEEAFVDLRNPEPLAAAESEAPGETEEPREPTETEPMTIPEVKPEEPKKVEKKKPTIVVPYVPTPRNVVQKMLELAEVKEGDVVYDLGCGDGRIVVSAVKDFKAARGVGIDLNEQRIEESRANAEKAGVKDKLTFKQGDVLEIKTVEDASVVTLYLLPEVNRRLKPMLKATLKPGSRVISHDFDMGEDWKPEKTVDVTDPDGIEHTIYLWRIPKEED